MVGRDPQADVHVASPLVSRAHQVLRCDGGRWVATDNGSLNGIFVDGRRVSTVALSDGQRLNIGDPTGPRLSFSVGRQTGSAPRPPVGRWSRRRFAPPAAGASPVALPRLRRQRSGRAADNDIVVADVLASRHHAMIVLDERRVWRFRTQAPSTARSSTASASRRRRCTRATW